jgi:HEAT repeat protein
VTSLGLSVQTLSVVTLALIGVWGLLAYRARRSYVDQFRTRLREQEASYESPDETDAPEVDTDELLDSLCSHAETEALQALDQLEEGTGPVPVDALLCLLDHPAAAVREQTLRVLRVREVEGVGEEVAEALRDRDPDVQLEAGRYLYCQNTDHRTERLRQGLDHEDPRVQAAMVGLIATEGDPEEYQLVSESLLRRLVALDGDRGPQTRTQVARLLGVLDRPYRDELLHRLLNDASTQVQRAAITAAGMTGNRSFVHALVQHLGDDALEAAARQALAAFEPPVLGTLYDYLVDERLDVKTRLRIPPIFVEQPGPFALNILTRGLRKVCLPVRHAIARALSKIHQEASATTSLSDTLDPEIERDTRHYAALGQVLRLHRKGSAPASLDAAPLRSLRQETLERIFRLLGLRYDQRDIYSAYLGITSPDPGLQDSAVEFVDNLVDYETRRYLLPLLDDPDAEHAVEVGGSFFDLSIRRWEDAREYLERADDPRLDALLDASDEADIDSLVDPRPDEPENGSPHAVSASSS